MNIPTQIQLSWWEITFQVMNTIPKSLKMKIMVRTMVEIVTKEGSNERE